MYGDGSDDDDEEVGADYKFSDFFVAEKAERRKATQRETKTQQKRRPTGSDESLDGEVSEGGEGRGNNDTSSAPSGEEDDGEDWEEEEEEEGGGESTGHNASTKAVAGGSKATPTPLQQRKAVLSTQIASLEEELIASKPWELRGEVKAADRPENSFLSLHADIERFTALPLFSAVFTNFYTQ